MKRRLKALKKLQLETTKVEAEFFKEVHALECKYQPRYQPFYEKRAQIIKGDYEPNDEECNWTLDDDKEDEELSDEMKSKVKIEGEKKEDDPKDIPEFWLTIIKNVDILADMVQEHDEPILKHLTDIKVHYKEEPMGFELEFFFSPNEFFENTVLTKTYEMKCAADEMDPFSFEGPEIHKCKVFASIPFQAEGTLHSFSSMAGIQNRLEERQKRHRQDDQEEAKAQVEGFCSHSQQNGSERLFLQFLRSSHW